MGCMQSSTESQMSQGATSSTMLYKLMNEGYDVEVHPPSLENASMIQRMELHESCPSEVFLNFDIDKCFLSHTTDSSSQSNDRTNDESRVQCKSQIISLKSTRPPKLAKRSSQITVSH